MCEINMCAAFLGKFWKPVGLGCLRGEIRCQQKLSGAGGVQGRVKALRIEGRGLAWRGVQFAGSREQQPPPHTHLWGASAGGQGLIQQPMSQRRTWGRCPWGTPGGIWPGPFPTIRTHSPAPAAPRQPFSSTVATVPSTPDCQFQGSGLAFAGTAQDAPEGAGGGS